MKRRRLMLLPAAASVAALGVAGCATAPPAPPPVPAVRDDRPVAGRLAVQVAAHGNRAARSVNADFDLQGSAQQGELQLATPMGTVLAQARWQPGEVWLRRSDGGEQRFATLTALAAEVLGEPLPLDALFDWLRGRPWPGAPHQRQAAGFEQLGWRVDLQRWSDGLVSASRSAVPAVTVRAKLAP